MTFSEQVAARTLYQEAGGEPIEGQLAVAHVLWNRLRDGRWGKSLATVCHAHWQFSAWWANDNGDRALFERSFDLADDDPELLALLAVLDHAMTEPDPTGGAMWYYAPSIPEPKWVPGATFCGKFGSQLFYKNVK